MQTDALANLIAGNVDELNRPADTDTSLKLTEKALRRRRLPIPMTIARDRDWTHSGCLPLHPRENYG